MSAVYARAVMNMGMDGSMVKVAGIVLAVLALSGCAMDWGKGYGRSPADDLDAAPVKVMRFRCESESGDQRYCSVDTRAGVRLVKQLSNTPCVQGRNWGYDRFGVWVTYGCRGEFVTGSSDKGGFLDLGHGVVRCESRERELQRCEINVYDRVELLRQVSGSPCTQDESWGWDASGIWVDRGCRADFRVH